ncbi:MAG: DMT family transporter [candidate division WOR-3 bacterium]
MFYLKKFRVISLAILANLLWSTAFVGVKIGLIYSSPLLFAGMRFILAGLFLLPFCGGVRNYFTSICYNIKTIIILSFFQTFLLYSLFFFGMTLVRGSTGAIVNGSAPLLAAVAAHIFLKNDKLSINKTIYILGGIFGIVLLSIDRQFIAKGSIKELIGILILLVATFASSIGNVIVAIDNSEIEPIPLNSAQMGLGGIMLLFLSLLVEGSPKVVFDKQFIFALIWLSFISAAGFSIWFYLLKKEKVKVSELNMWKFIVPGSGALISWMFLKDDSPTPLSIMGMVIVATSVLLFNLRKITP